MLPSRLPTGLTRAAVLVAGIVVVVGGMPAAGTAEDVDTVVRGGYDEKEMEAAIARARKEVDDFIAVFQKKEGDKFAVKVRIEDGEEVEHFWIIDLAYNDGKFEGVINNEPATVTNVEMGQKVTVKKDEISDWMYIRDEKVYGNYTLRPLLAAMSKEQADKFRAILAEP